MPVKPVTQQGSIGRSVEGRPALDIHPGAVISINLNRASVLATPCKRVALSFAHPTVRIPHDISEGSLHALRQALSEEKIVVDHEPILKEPDAKKIQPYLDAVTEARDAKSLRPTLVKIVTSVRNLDGLTAFQLLDRLAQFEADGPCRQEILVEIGEAMDHTFGTLGVEEHPQDDEKVRINPNTVDGVGGGVGGGEPVRSREDEEAVEELI